MKSEFLREQQRYTQKELRHILGCTEAEITAIIKKLKEYGVIKAVKSSWKEQDRTDLSDDEIEVADVIEDDNELFYVLTYVGIIVVRGYVLKCYPKYLVQTAEPINEMCQIIKVLERLNESEQIIKMFNESDESRTFNLIAVLLYLLRDYYENGVYDNSEEIVETNGTGEIIWDKTINDTFALLHNNRPYYLELKTQKIISDDFDYFKRLHECILTRVSRELSETGLNDLFELTEVDLSEEQLNDFGEKDYILSRIEKELNVQFNTRKHLLLKVMFAYVKNDTGFSSVECLSMYGTNSFNMVWEKVCKKILNDQLQKPLKELQLPIPLMEEDNKETKKGPIRLIDLIEKPLWTFTGKEAEDTLIPDVITIDVTDEKSEFVIIDAKYYVPTLEVESVPKSVPGIESVTKQYLYQLAYREFIDKYQFTSVKNFFIMPTQKGGIIDKGEVVMEMLQKKELENIEVRMLSAKLAFSKYLAGERLTITELENATE